MLGSALNVASLINSLSAKVKPSLRNGIAKNNLINNLENSTCSCEEEKIARDFIVGHLKQQKSNSAQKEYAEFLASSEIDLGLRIEVARYVQNFNDVLSSNFRHYQGLLTTNFIEQIPEDHREFYSMKMTMPARLSLSQEADANYNSLKALTPRLHAELTNIFRETKLDKLLANLNESGIKSCDKDDMQAISCAIERLEAKQSDGSYSDQLAGRFLLNLTRDLTNFRDAIIAYNLEPEVLMRTEIQGNGVDEIASLVEDIIRDFRLVLPESAAVQCEAEGLELKGYPAVNLDFMEISQEYIDSLSKNSALKTASEILERVNGLGISKQESTTSKFRITSLVGSLVLAAVGLLNQAGHVDTKNDTPRADSKQQVNDDSHNNVDHGNPLKHRDHVSKPDTISNGKPGKLEKGNVFAEIAGEVDTFYTTQVYYFNAGERIKSNELQRERFPLSYTMTPDSRKSTISLKAQDFKKGDTIDIPLSRGRSLHYYESEDNLEVNKNAQDTKRNGNTVEFTRDADDRAVVYEQYSASSSFTAPWTKSINPVPDDIAIQKLREPGLAPQFDHYKMDLAIKEFLSDSIYIASTDFNNLLQQLPFDPAFSTSVIRAGDCDTLADCLAYTLSGIIPCGVKLGFSNSDYDRTLSTGDAHAKFSLGSDINHVYKGTNGSFPLDYDVETTQYAKESYFNLNFKEEDYLRLLKIVEKAHNAEEPDRQHVLFEFKDALKEILKDSHYDQFKPKLGLDDLLDSLRKLYRDPNSILNKEISNIKNASLPGQAAAVLIGLIALAIPAYGLYRGTFAIPNAIYRGISARQRKHDLDLVKDPRVIKALERLEAVVTNRMEQLITNYSYTKEDLINLNPQQLELLAVLNIVRNKTPFANKDASSIYKRFNRLLLRREASLSLTEEMNKLKMATNLQPHELITAINAAAKIIDSRSDIASPSLLQARRKVLIEIHPILFNSKSQGKYIPQKPNERGNKFPLRGDNGFRELRDYQAGDDMRDIDWRATAKAAKPIVKVRDDDESLDRKKIKIDVDIRNINETQLQDFIDLLLLAQAGKIDIESVSLYEFGKQIDHLSGQNSMDKLLASDNNIVEFINRYLGLSLELESLVNINGYDRTEIIQRPFGLRSLVINSSPLDEPVARPLHHWFPTKIETSKDYYRQTSLAAWEHQLSQGSRGRKAHFVFGY